MSGKTPLTIRKYPNFTDKYYVALRDGTRDATAEEVARWGVAPLGSFMPGSAMDPAVRHPQEDAFQFPAELGVPDEMAIKTANYFADVHPCDLSVREAPDSNPKTQVGIRKPGVRAIPPVSLLHLGAAMENGCQKYGLTNWREHSVSASVYYEAAQRHLMAWWDGEQVADDSKVHHLGHVMACCAIILDAEAQGSLNDDRPAIPGKFSEMVAAMIDAFPETLPPVSDGTYYHDDDPLGDGEG
jgi:hypothetical protein